MEQDSRNSQSRFLQYFQQLVDLGDNSVSASPMPSLISLLDEKGHSAQAVLDQVHESRWFFELIKKYQFFAFMRPTLSVRSCCATCKDVRYEQETDPYFVFDITLPDKSDFYIDLGALLEQTHFQNSEITTTCQQCKNPSAILKRENVLADGKQGLVICLGRFLNNPNWRKNMLPGQGEGLPALKNNRKVCIPNNKILLKDVNSDIVAYELVSTIEHLGDRTDNGHYRSHIRTQNDQWWCADDDKTLQKSNTVDIESSTLFLFKRVPFS